jgi:hypothetical protein
MGLLKVLFEVWGILIGWKLMVQLLITKNVHFVNLSKCVTDLTIAFLSLRWSKNIYGTSNLGSGWGSYASEKISIWATGTSGLRPELPVAGGGRRSFTRKWTTGTSGLRPELPMGTRTSGGAWWEVPIGLIPNLTLRSRTDLFLDQFWDMENLENKPWRGFLLG